MIKNILCYGDSNSWGNIAGSFNPKVMSSQRYDYSDFINLSTADNPN